MLFKAPNNSKGYGGGGGGGFVGGCGDSVGICGRNIWCGIDDCGRPTRTHRPLRYQVMCYKIQFNSYFSFETHKIRYLPRNFSPIPLDYCAYTAYLSYMFATLQSKHQPMP